MTLRILLVDDHKMFRDALRALLEREPGLLVVAEASHGAEALLLTEQCRPDIVCMDIGMPGINGIETTRQLMQAHPLLKVIALSTFAEKSFVLDMLKVGAAAYVTKAEASEELLRAIDAVQRNRSYFCPDVATLIAGSISQQDKADLKPIPLGIRERQVLQLVTQGQTSVSIGNVLKIATSTVEVHRRNIMRKLDLHSVAELTRYVIEHHLDRD